LSFRSIRTRLTLWYVGLLTVTFFILGGAAYLLLSYSLNQEMDNALKGVARVLVERADIESRTFFPGDVDEIFRRFFGFSPVQRYYQMIDPLGRRGSDHPAPHSGKLPLSEKALDNASRGLSTFETVHGLDDHPVRIVTMPVMKGGRLSSLVQVGMPMQSVAATRFRFLLVMAAVLPVALLLAGFGGWVLLRRALQPVDRMTAAAQRISAEHLAQRVEETGAGDELDRLAKTLNQMLVRLDAAFSQVRQFSANASHELQTPLTILRGELEVALRSSRPAEEYQATLKSALEEIDRISQLVEGLLLLSRTEAGVVRIDRQPFDMAELVEEVYWRLKVLADAHSVDLILNAPAPAMIEADRERLRQLLINLVENGIKYTEPGGAVAIILEHDDRFIALQITDTGVGISPEDQERIFQPFYRAPQAIPHQGAGLGLSIVHSVALAHGGCIEVQSAPGTGSTFRVTIPHQEAKASP